MITIDLFGDGVALVEAREEPKSDTVRQPTDGQLDTSEELELELVIVKRT